MGKEYVKLLLLLLVLLHHGDSASIIRSLPGFEGPLPFELETGYIGVGEAEEVQLFYYFIKSERNPEEDPLLLWLSGGPGCSSLGAFLVENGPMTLKMNAYNGSTPSLVSTTYSWTKVANMIYLDQPVGSGFSYSTNPFADIPSDTGEAKRVHEFVQKWLSKHPDFLSNPFYIAGNSYAGKVVPAIVQEISKGNYICCKPQINLQGYVLGDPSTNNDYGNYWIPFAHGMALISDELYESLKSRCGGNYKDVDPLNVECLKLIKDFHKLISAINTEFILAPNCDETSPDCYKYRSKLCSYWANDNSVHNALQVDKESTKRKWERCYLDIPYKQDIISSVPYHKNNSINGYRSLIYNGDHDMVMPFLGTQAWIRSLNYSVVDDWRPWMINNQVAGYTRTYANKMTFATIKARRWTHYRIQTNGELCNVPKVDKWPSFVTGSLPQSINLPPQLPTSVEF